MLDIILKYFKNYNMKYMSYYEDDYLLTPYNEHKKESVKKNDFELLYLKEERKNYSSLSFFQKLKLIGFILFSKKLFPVIKINENISIDLKSNKIIFNMPFKIISNENIELVSKKHIILESGKTKENERENYIYSIWLNPPRDALNRPKKAEE